MLSFMKRRKYDCSPDIDNFMKALDNYTDAKILAAMKMINGSPSGVEINALKFAEKTIRDTLTRLATRP